MLKLTLVGICCLLNAMSRNSVAETEMCPDRFTVLQWKVDVNEEKVGNRIP